MDELQKYLKDLDRREWRNFRIALAVAVLVLSLGLLITKYL
jgi:hypothetical protein